MKKFLFIIFVVIATAIVLGACATKPISTKSISTIEPASSQERAKIVFDENLPQTLNDKSEEEGEEIEKTFGTQQTLKGKSEEEIQKKFGEPKTLLIMNAVKPENRRALYIYYIASQKDLTALYIYFRGNTVNYAEYNEYNGYVSSDFFDVFLEDNKSAPK